VDAIPSSMEARLARWATGALASSFVFMSFAVAALVTAHDLGVLFRDHPVGVVSVALLFGCYVVSFTCLQKIQKGSSRHGDLMWMLSLLTAAAPVLALMYWFGPIIGLIIGFAEVIAVVIHIVAIADV